MEPFEKTKNLNSFSKPLSYPLSREEKTDQKKLLQTSTKTSTKIPKMNRLIT